MGCPRSADLARETPPRRRPRSALALATLLVLLAAAAPGAPDCGPAPVDEVLPACDPLGERRCEGAVVVECVADADPVAGAAWVEVAVCAPGRVCDEGACVAGQPYPGACVEETTGGENEWRYERRWSERGDLVSERRWRDDVLLEDRVWTFAYDAAGRRTYERHEERAPAERRIHRTYGADGEGGTWERVEDSQAGGVYIHRTYDGEGRLAEEWESVGAASTHRTFSYDAAGRRARVEEDSPADQVAGDVDAVTTWTWTDERTEVEALDDDADGTVDVQWTRVHDAAGRVVREERDGDADGRPERRTTREYKPDGGLVERVDEGDDGTVEETSVERHGADGLPLARSTRGLRGRRETAWTYERDEQGRLTSTTEVRRTWAVSEVRTQYLRFQGGAWERTVATGEGPDDVRLQLTLADAAGRHLSRSTWRGSPPRPSSRLVTSYDAQGRRVLVRLYEGDPLRLAKEVQEVWSEDGRDHLVTYRDGDGNVTLAVHTVTGEDGRSTVEERDRNGDGQWDERRVTTWEERATGDVKTISLDGRTGPLDGVPEHVDTVEYDAEGRLRTVTWGAGDVDSYAWSEDGRTEECTKTWPSGATSWWRRTYDATGNVLLYEWEGLNDRAGQVTYDYACYR